MVYHAAVAKRKNALRDMELVVATEIEEKKRKRRTWPEGKQSRIAKNVRAGRRLPPPVPKNRSLAEIHEMTGDEPSLKAHGPKGSYSGKPRKHFVSDFSLEIKPDLSFHDMVRADKQKRHNLRRMKVRKWEAEVVKAVEVLSVGTGTNDHNIDIYDEERAVAEGILTLDDWDNEELIRGYRRNRDGKFGKPPKYIPMEVQHEAFRRLVHRGNRRLREAYMDTIENLVDLAHNAISEKVRLEAQKELLNRVVGKVPDIVVGAQMEQPWENILADTILPMGEGSVIDLEMDDSGVAHMIPYGESPPPSPDAGGPSGGAPPTKVVADGGDSSVSSPSKPTTRSAADPVPRKRSPGARRAPTKAKKGS